MTQPFRAGMIGAAEPLPAERADEVVSSSLFDGLMLDFQDVFGFRPPRGPAEARPLGTFVEHRHDGPAGSRTYKLYTPARAEAGVALPLVVMLHGCNQGPDEFAAGTRMNAWAERDGFLVCYPVQPASANGQRCWNWFKGAEQRRGAGEPALVAGIVADVMARRDVDRARIYAAGLSAGGALAATLGQLYPDVFAAVGVHSGLACGAARDVGSALQAMRHGGGPHAADSRGDGAPAIVFHGDRDGTVSAVNGEEVAAQVLGRRTAREEVRAGAVPNGHAFRSTRMLGDDGRALVERWEVRGAGHAWSGGSPAGSFTDPHGPDASGEMLRFFAEHVGARAPR